MSIEVNKTQTEELAVETLGQKFARWIDDPLGSVLAGIAFPTAAVGVVIGGIYGLTAVQ